MTKQPMHRHHRLPRSLNGNRHVVNGHNNISYVQQNHHRAWHNIFRNYTAQEICAIINDVWLDPNYKFICIPREKGNYKKRKNK